MTKTNASALSPLPNVAISMLSSDFWTQKSEAVGTHAEAASTHRQSVQQYILEHTDTMYDVVDLWERCKQAVMESDRPALPTPPSPPSPPPALYGADGDPLPTAFWDEMAASVGSARPVTVGPVDGAVSDGDQGDQADQRASAQAGTSDQRTSAQPGFAVRRANVRRYPTEQPGFREATDREFDRLQDTALHTFEPLLVLLETADRAWYYIVSTTYAGWVRSDNVAMASDEDFRRWATFAQEGRPFIIPMSNAVYTQASPYDPAVSKVNLEFAAYIPLADADADVTRSSGHDTGASGQARPSALGNQSPVGNLRVYLPVRNDAGQLEVHEAFVSAFSPFSFGFRTYTRASVVDSAFRLLSERYGWGDSFGCHDCSSLVMDSYRTVGIQFPRDAGSQEHALPNFLATPADASFADRTELLKELSAGDPLYMPGHTMMYLGYRDGHHYMIHDFAGYVDSGQPTSAEAGVTEGASGGSGDGGLNAAGARSVPVNEVMVSTLDILTSRSRTYLEELTGAGRLFI